MTEAIKFIKEAIKLKVKSKDSVLKLKRKIAKESKKPLLSNNLILQIYKELLNKGKIKEYPLLFDLLRKRDIRTLSGVAPVAVLTKPYLCPGGCIYCPYEEGMPKSYLSNEPAAARAKKLNFDPFLQVKNRIKVLEENGHDVDKIELIVIGGTWSFLPKTYQTWFIKNCFSGANGKKTKTLSKAQKINERAKHRIIGLTLETRPDYINISEIKRMRKLGATRVEIGLQSIYDDVLEKIKRGHNVQTTIKAIRLLKDAGFKICAHIMPNLPGSDLKRDFEMFRNIFENPAFKPDMIKIYPTVVLKNTTLYQWFKEGKFRPYSDEELIDLLIKIKKIVPYFVRINRVYRDIPAPSIEGGSKISNLREVIQKEIEKQNLKCKCIRCREARQKKVDWNNIKFFSEKYHASRGQEYFLSLETPNRETIYAFLRLRIPSQFFTKEKHFIKELEGAALIREIHTYGKLMPLKKTKEKRIQHLGLGKFLMKKAEEKVKKLKIKKIAVISGIGVREYYRKLGYCLVDTYMIKKIN